MKKPTKAFHALNDNKIPARIHAILAREAAKAVVDVVLRRSPKFLGPREKLPPPVEDDDDLEPPDDCESAPGTFAVEPADNRGVIG